MYLNSILLTACCLLCLPSCGEPGSAADPSGEPGSVADPSSMGPNLDDTVNFLENPRIDSISPDRGPNCGGSLVTIVGQNFSTRAVVRFGDLPAVDISVWSATRLTVRLPPSSVADQPVSVSVENPDGKSVTRSGLFRYHGCGLNLVGQIFALGRHDWLITDDFDQDGQRDVLTKGVGVLNVRLSSERGTFASPRVLSPGCGEVDFAQAADWNGDRMLDLMVSCKGSTPYPMALLLGDGRGGFSAPRFQNSTTCSPFGAVADWDGDGKLDVLSLDYDGNFCLMSGDGAGGFGTGKQIASVVNIYRPLVADVNTDGKKDLLFFTYPRTGDPSRLIVWLGDGAAGFSQLVSLSPFPFTPDSVLALDVNQDGKIDLVAGRDRIMVSLGDGKGQFGPAVSASSLPVGSYDLSTGDVNLDGIPDLIARRWPHCWTLLGRGDGTFPTVISHQAVADERPGRYPPLYPSRISTSVLDYDGDGRPDLIRNTDYGVVVYLGDGSGRLMTPRVFPSLTEPIVVGDLNQDQNLDLVGDGGAVSVLGDGRGGAAEIGAGTPFPGVAQVLLLADVNGDRGADLIGSTLVGGVYRVGIKLANGLAAFGLPIDLGVVSTSPQKLVAADFNRDSRADLAILDVASRTLNIVFGDGLASFSNRIALSLTGTSPVSLATADLNSDRTPDLVLGQSGAAIVLLGNGRGGFGTPLSFSLSGIASYLAMGDVNGDGRIDLVYSDPATNGVGILLGDGVGGLTLFNAIPVAGGATCGVLADLNADSKLDLVLGGTVLQAALGDGNGSFAEVQAFAGSTGAYCPIVAEFTGDGRIDVLARGRLFFGPAQ